MAWRVLVYCLTRYSQGLRWLSSNKCGNCPLTMLIYCGLAGHDLGGSTVMTRYYARNSIFVTCLNASWFESPKLKNVKKMYRGKIGEQIEKTQLPCWPLYSQQVSHQRWIWDHYRRESTKGREIYPGFEKQDRHHQKSKIRISETPHKRLVSSKKDWRMYILQFQVLGFHKRILGRFTSKLFHCGPHQLNLELEYEAQKKREQQTIFV